MFNRIESTIEPLKFKSLNNGVWYYNYDILSEVRQVPKTMHDDEMIDLTFYNFVLVRVLGEPTYEKCVRAIIRSYISENDEFNLINSYNSYLLDIGDIDTEYAEYLQTIKTIKDKVRKDFNIDKSISTNSIPKLSDIIKLMLMTINTMDLTDALSLSVKSLYPDWNTFIGTTISVNTKVQYNGKLFKVLLEHLVLSLFPPSILTASLYTEIVEDHLGTIDDPILYPEDGNMIIYKDKYYLENGIIYKCIRNSEQPLYAALSTLIDNYVQKVDLLF